MPKIPTCLLLFAFLSASIVVSASVRDLDVRLKHGTESEKLTEQQFRRITAEHDLSPWIQTRSIVVDEETIPHSHPVLTLHTRHLDDDGLFISTFIHEQMHWWLGNHPRQTALAIRDLKARYKTLPVGYPDGANNLQASYEHLLVIYLELEGARAVLGDVEAARVLAFWEGDHYKTRSSIASSRPIAPRYWRS